ncbi:Spore coat associated protein JA (CotJA) [Caminicella sporogenes DSM 14501]|uniref:Spore coat associated protein JA (CotJA) n=1 Tax=Caminicella sporogenes DSM 14501 TaxID=1121266 RepID=A0A1M6MWE6_9FIRM|nr:spore coat associated protein CotJA [Caminicella sporogenes]WIF94996.1 spore coat associated protein CotJA [Caminicella sporogenes]SHJ87739.1 Spore coat associated protein JA (CotJA) [Caminicella sporogenes DSM 14501]
MKENQQMHMHMLFPQIEGLELARAYIMSQPYAGMMPLDIALKRGSLFPNLYKPYKA